MMLGMYKKWLKSDAIVTIDLIYHSVLCLYGKEIENDRRNCGFILYKYVQQSITFNTFLDTFEQNIADNCRNAGNPEKLDCCCYPRNQGLDPKFSAFREKFCTDFSEFWIRSHFFIPLCFHSCVSTDFKWNYSWHTIITEDIQLYNTYVLPDSHTSYLVIKL